MSKKIGLFGGTFNPVHLGHMSMVAAFQKQVQPDLILVMPCALPPHKQTGGEITNAQRMELVQAAFAGWDHLTVDSYEMEKGGKSYTVETLRHLNDIYPGDEIILLVGEDSFLAVDRWVEPEEILQRCTLCGLPRNTGMSDDRTRFCFMADHPAKHLSVMEEKAAFLQQTYGAKTILLREGVAPYSSTQVRQALGEGANPAFFVPAACADLIRKNGWYGWATSCVQPSGQATPAPLPSDFQPAGAVSTPAQGKALAAMLLGQYRFHHTSCVAEKARTLCQTHFPALDPDDAELAGWLHDLCKELPRQNLLQIAAQYGMITVKPDGTVENWKNIPPFAPALWHSLIGAQVARQLGAKEEISRAVGCHTQGAPDMTPMEQLLFVADCASMDRTYPDAAYLRQLADADLNAATAFIFSFVLADLAKKGAQITPRTLAGYEFYRTALPKRKDSVSPA